MARMDEKERWILASLLLNLTLAGVKAAWAMWAGGGTVVLADAVHSASDVLGAALVWGAIRFARHRSERFPFGLHKLEDLAAVIGALAVVWVAWWLAVPIISGTSIEYATEPLSTVIFLAVLVVLQIGFFLMERAAAKRLRSPGLESDVLNWLGDIGADSVVIAGVAASMFGVPYAQEAAVVALVILVAHGAFSVLRDSGMALLDAGATAAQLEAGRKVLEEVPEVTRVVALRMRRAGSVLFADAVVEVAGKSFDEVHERVDHLDVRMREVLPEVEYTTIHYEPGTGGFRFEARLLADEDDHIPESPAAIRRVELRRIGATSHEEVAIRDVPEGRPSTIRFVAWLIRCGVDRVILPEGGVWTELHNALVQADIESVVGPSERTTE